jgi:hypothetical protein
MEIKSMDENKNKILQMLSEGKISVEEASRLLYLVGEERKTDNSDNVIKKSKANAKYLYVKVNPKEGHQDSERVNVRIPISLVRAGMKLTALMPPEVADNVNKAMKDKGMGFDIRNLDNEFIEQLVDALKEEEIDIDSEEASIKVYAE